MTQRNPEATELLQCMVLAAWREGGRGKLAARLGISPAMLSGMLSQKKPIPDRIARMFGFERRVIYTRTSDVDGALTLARALDN